jgi:hypothetical protein
MQVRKLVARSVRHGLLPALTVVLILVVAPAALAASGDLTWSFAVDSPPHWEESAQQVVPGPDGTAYVAGSWAAWLPIEEKSDMVLLRVRPAASPSGAVVWRRTWDDPADHLADYVNCLATDPAGNAIVAGFSYSSASDTDLVVIKWKANGRRAWVARYGSPYAMLDYPVDMACDGRGNVIVTGIRYLLGNEDADWVTTKFRAGDGKRLWARVWSGTEKPASDDRPAALAVDAAGYSYSVGRSDDANGVHDAIVMKRTPAGKLAWTRRVDRTMYGSDEAERVALAGGRLCVAGAATDLGVTRLQALKYSTGGKQLWTRTWELPDAELGQVRDLVVDRAGNIVIAGQAVRSDRGHALVASWTSAGQLRWTDVSAPNVVATATATSVVVDRAGTTWAAGYTSLNNSGRLLKYDATGTRIWAQYLDVDGSTRNYFGGLCLWGSGSLAVVGSTTSDATRTDLLVAKYVR